MRASNALLYQMLPAAIMDQLKEGRTCVSDHFEGVSLLFCDIKGCVCGACLCCVAVFHV